jgi:hypothetical protein
MALQHLALALLSCRAEPEHPLLLVAKGQKPQLIALIGEVDDADSALLG